MLRTLGDSIGNDGIEMELSDGRKIKIRPLTLKDLAAFEKWLEGRAFASVQAVRDQMDTTTWAEMAGAVAGQIAAGKYAFGGQMAADAMRTIPGALKIFSLITGMTESQAKEVMEKDGGAVQRAMEMMVSRSMPEGDQQEGNPAGG